MIFALLVILLVLALAGGLALHPGLFALALVAVILLVLAGRGGRVP